MIKVSIHQKDITIIKVYGPNSRIPKIHEVKKLSELKGKIDNSTIISWRLQYYTYNNGQNN